MPRKRSTRRETRGVPAWRAAAHQLFRRPMLSDRIVDPRWMFFGWTVARVLAFKFPSRCCDHRKTNQQSWGKRGPRGGYPYVRFLPGGPALLQGWPRTWTPSARRRTRRRRRPRKSRACRRTIMRSANGTSDRRLNHRQDIL